MATRATALALLLWALFIGAIVPTIASEKNVDCIRAQRSAWAWSLSKADASKFCSRLGFVQNAFIQSIAIDYIHHHICKLFPFAYRSKDFNLIATEGLNSCVRADELRRFFGISDALIKYGPRFLHILGGKGAFCKEQQVLCPGITAIREFNSEVNTTYFRVALANGLQNTLPIDRSTITKHNGWVFHSDGYKSPLADNVILASQIVGLANQMSLPPSEDGGKNRNRQCPCGYAVSVFVVLVGIVVICFGPWFAGRGHDNLGLIVVLIGVVVFAYGIYLFLGEFD